MKKGLLQRRFATASFSVWFDPFCAHKMGAIRRCRRHCLLPGFQRAEPFGRLQGQSPLTHQLFFFRLSQSTTTTIITTVTR